MKKETLEEVAENGWFNTNSMSAEHKEGFIEGFIQGANYQAERTYSEDEVRELLIKALTHNDYNLCGSLVTAQQEIRTANFGVWFEENKKK